MRYIKTLVLYIKSHTHRGLKRSLILSLLFVTISVQPAVAELESLFWDTEYFQSTTSVLAEINNPVPKIEEGIYLVTGYSSTPDQTDSSPDIMASGKKVYDGAIACPRKYEFGTKVEISGKLYTCEDRMALKHDGANPKFDIWYSSRELAKNHGVQKVRVIVYKD